MFYKRVVQKALKSTWEIDNKPGLTLTRVVRGQDTIVSKLIYDIFGGEILKTRKKRSWHFYNRINGERIDFTDLESEETVDANKFEDLPSTPAETSGYFDWADYLTFLMRFVKAFEEGVGLEQYKQMTT
jgi:hypothetical protein